ncbi:site-specific integrase [Trichloromonas sp.]|uniref:site-specific integrase n=1 Tax=Trichloromonas sp. TaxID=3069249 RepID=UPI002A4972CE|nr:site-specific integrase [Trichloromonas sp.]
MATITKRGEKWCVRVRRRGATAINRTFTRRADAEAFARKTEAEIETGDYRDSDELARKTTLAAAANDFAREHLSKLRDAHRAQNRLCALLERTGWGALSLSSLRARDVAAYVQEREDDGYAPDTIRLDLAVISRLYKHAKQMWDMETLKNPVDAVRRPSLRGTARTRRLEAGEEARLLAASRPDFRHVVLFALETAMRREEIATLTWEHVDLERRTAHLPRTKNGEARTVPLSAAALAVLRGMPNYTPDAKKRSGAVFGLSKDQITNQMRRTARRAGIIDLRFHDLRHEATSRLFERGTLDMIEVATVTGHKTMQMLKRYTHLRAEQIAEKLS